MEIKKFIFTIMLVVNSTLFVLADDGSSTENVVTFEEESSTSASLVKRGRSLSVDENSIKSESRRNPKFGFSVPFPNIPGINGDTNATPTPTPDTHVFGGMTSDLSGTTASLGTTAVLIKGGILSGLLALKAAVLPPLFLGALILFLIAGAGFFTCSIINCNRLIGDIAGPAIAPGFGGLPPFSPFNRNGIDDYEQRPVYQAIDDGYKKYN